MPSGFPARRAPRAAGLLALAALVAPHGERGSDPGALWVRGVTVSCQTWGREWGTDAFARELDRLRALGATWVAIHPYARVHGDGSLTWRPIDPDDPPAWLARPAREARARGLELLVVPHLAHWGSPFSWRGAIDFPEPEARARFFADYRRFLLAVAEAVPEAGALCVGSELDRLVEHEAPWRALIAELRARTDAHLTYAANWTDYRRVPFWDALDAIGVQAYFPLSAAERPSEEDLLRAWRPILADLRALHERTGKPVVFVELGYDAAPHAASEPWRSGTGGHHGLRAPAPAPDALELQERCLRVALRAIEDERAWLRGALLWKWFAGPAPGEDFVLDRPALREVLAKAWGGEPPPADAGADVAPDGG